MLALTFDKEEDYEKIQENDILNFVDLIDFAPEKPLHVELIHVNGNSENDHVESHL